MDDWGIWRLNFNMNWMIAIFLLSANFATAQVLTNPPARPEGLQNGAAATYGLKDWIDLIQGASVIIASGVAIWGINAWRREFVGKRRIELAEEVLALFYQAKDVVGWMRHPASLAAESATRKPQSAETSEQRGLKDSAYVFSKRYSQDSELFSRIHALRYRFMAQFGKNASIPFDELKSVLDDLFTALDMWVMLSGVDVSRHNAQELQAHQARIEKHEKIVWSLGKDSISSRIENAIVNVERICRPHIDRKSIACETCQPVENR